MALPWVNAGGFALLIPATEIVMSLVTVPSPPWVAPELVACSRTVEDPVPVGVPVICPVVGLMLSPAGSGKDALTEKLPATQLLQTAVYNGLTLAT